MELWFKRIQLSLARVPPVNAFALPGVRETDRDGRKVRLEVQGVLNAVMEKACEYGIEDLDTPPVTLEEVFLTFYDPDRRPDDV